MLLQEPYRPDDSVAVIGGGAIENFGIDDTPFAFETLSDALYSDKPLAVVREYICNAVDAHIAAGVTRPIEITLTDAAFKVRDFGLGIPHAKIGHVYCVLFGSNKQADERQTGGFGLGSKSGFAYTDHFTVTNAHEGQRAVYAMQKGDEDTGGKPGFRRMGRSACQDSGVEVAIPLDKDDRAKFEALICRVVKDGGMDAKLNGELLAKTDYTELKAAGYAIEYKRMGTGISVLFGNVRYDVASFCDFMSAGEALKAREALFLPRHCLILFAPPSSVRPTPSRESLSMSPMTKDTLRRIVRRAMRETQGLRQKVFNRRIREMVRDCDRLEYVRLANIHIERPFLASMAGPQPIAEMQVQAALEGREYTTRHIDIANRQLGRRALDITGWDRGDFRYFKKLGQMLRTDHRNTCRALIFKVLGKAGALRQTRFRPECDRHCYPLHKWFERQRIDAIKGDNINVWNQKAEIFIAATVSDLLKTAHYGYGILEREVKPEQIAAVRALAPKFGLTIVEVQKPAPRIKAEVVEKIVAGHPLFIGPVLDDTMLRPFELPSSEKGYAAPLRMMPSAKFYFEPRSYEAFGEYETNSARDQRLLKLFYPDTCLVLNDKDRRQAETRGATRLEEKMLEDVKARLQSAKHIDRLAIFVAALLGYSSNGGLLSNNWAPRRMREAIRKILKSSVRNEGLGLIGETAWGDKEKAVYDYWTLAFRVLSDRFDGGARSAHKARAADIKGAFLKLMREQINLYFLTRNGWVEYYGHRMQELVPLIKESGNDYYFSRPELFRMMIATQLKYHNIRKDRAYDYANDL